VLDIIPLLGCVADGRKRSDFAARREPDHDPSRARARQSLPSEGEPRARETKQGLFAHLCTCGADASRASHASRSNRWRGFSPGAVTEVAIACSGRDVSKAGPDYARAFQALLLDALRVKTA
jgi:hypothetical protein